MRDLIIIGGGPAGLTAAIYALRKRLDVLLVSMDLGGKTNFHLELPDQERIQTIRGLEIVNKFRTELEYLNFALLMDKVTGVVPDENHFKVHTEKGEELQTRAVVIATGTRQRWLNVPGEKEFLSRGLCYSALSYAPLFIDKKAVVIGHDDLALRAAAELSTVAEKVFIVGPEDAIMKTPLGRKLTGSANVQLFKGYQVTRVVGQDYCTGVIVRSPEGKEMLLEADGTFIEEALLPNSEPVASLVELDDRGFIVVDPYSRTSVPGIFAAGDVTNIFAEQVLVAVGEGVKAALSAYDYLLPLLAWQPAKELVPESMKS